VKKLTASDAALADSFGQSVAARGALVVVGATGEDDEGDKAGAAYVFHRNQNGADNWGEIRKLTASDAQEDDWFGYSVAVDDEIILVGANKEDGGEGDTQIDAGAAYIFTGFGEWQEVAVRQSSEIQPDDYFGFALSLSGDTMVVGAPYEDGGIGDLLSSAGAAYVFSRNRGMADGWGQARILRASDSADMDEFGISVSVSGDVIVVGAAYEDGGPGDPTSGSGAAYIFYRNQGGADKWGEVRILHASGPEVSASFGIAVSISGDTAVVGALFQGASDAGAAYVFSMNQGSASNWGQVNKITASDAQMEDHFGCSVAIDGGTIVVGAYTEDGGLGDLYSDAGAAYVFAENQNGPGKWGQVQKLSASDIEIGAYFGMSVAIDDQQVVVGAPMKDSGGILSLPDVGVAYLFARNQGGVESWGQVKKLSASDFSTEDNFGSSVAISNVHVLVGAYHEDFIPEGSDDNTGTAYVFHRNQGGGDNWGEVRKLRAKNMSSGGQFGISVSIDDELLAVGAYLASPGGEVTIFQLDQIHLYLPVVKK
jgi:hypothetical protein